MAVRAGRSREYALRASLFARCGWELTGIAAWSEVGGLERSVPDCSVVPTFECNEARVRDRRPKTPALVER